MNNNISLELAVKFGLPAIEDYPFTELDWYTTFLIQSDYVANKIAEAMFLGEEPDEDYTDVIQARKVARAKVNELRGQL